jgi:hypothetical protein
VAVQFETTWTRVESACFQGLKLKYEASAFKLCFQIQVAPQNDGGGVAARARGGTGPGRAVQVDPMKPKLKPPGTPRTRRLKLIFEVLLSTSAFKFLAPLQPGTPAGQSRRRRVRARLGRAVEVDPMKPKSKPPGTKRFKLKIDILLSTLAFKFKLRRCNSGGRVAAHEAALPPGNPGRVRYHLTVCA